MRCRRAMASVFPDCVCCNERTRSSIGLIWLGFRAIAPAKGKAVLWVYGLSIRDFNNWITPGPIRHSDCTLDHQCMFACPSRTAELYACSNTPTVRVTQPCRNIRSRRRSVRGEAAVDRQADADHEARGRAA